MSENVWKYAIARKGCWWVITLCADYEKALELIKDRPDLEVRRVIYATKPKKHKKVQRVK